MNQLRGVFGMCVLSLLIYFLGFTQMMDKSTYHPTILPEDTTRLWISSGDVLSDTVLIIGEGGPKYCLDFEASGRVYWEYLPNHRKYLFAVIHQSSTINKSILAAPEFTLEDAVREVDISSEIMYRSIKYFKDRGKYVAVFGHSYSAFVIPNYLATRPSLADKYIITGGRLNADSVQTAYQLRGVNTQWKSDGQTLIVPDENEEPNINRTARYWQIRKNKELLKYVVGLPRYTDQLEHLNLSNLIFYYGLNDENVGALSEPEISFLRSRGAIVKGVETDHYDIWKRVVDAFQEGNIDL